MLYGAILTLLAIIGAGCGDTDGLREPGAVSAGSNFVVELGHTVVVADREVTITFDAVIDDSRCPVGKICVWEGDATVRLVVRTRGQSTSIILHTSSRFATSADAAGLRVHLIDLNTAANRLTLRVGPV